MRTPKLPISLLIVPFLLAVTASPAAAATVGKQCRRSCRAQRAACVGSFREAFVAAKDGCGDRACRREARRVKQAETKRCRAARDECTACCRANPGAGCNVEVLGDGRCGGRAEPAEECDGRDAAACPGECNACKCPDEPSLPFVGTIGVGATVLASVDDAPGAAYPFWSYDGFTVDVRFETNDDIVSAQGSLTGCSVSRFDFVPAGAAYTPLDAGASGQMSTGETVAELIGAGGDGYMTSVELPAALLAAGFGHGAEVGFAFPGGADIGAFEASVVVPPPLDLSVPDVRDPLLRLDFTRPLELVWTARDPDETIGAFVNARNATEGAIAHCMLPDTGTGTVPAEILAQLPADPTSVLLTVHRATTEHVTVPLVRGGHGMVVVSALAGVHWQYWNEPLAAQP